MKQFTQLAKSLKIKNMNLKLIFKTISWMIIAVILLIAGLTALSTISTPLQFKMFIVESGSMEPTIQTGSIVIIKPQNEYKKNDIITFKRNEDVDIKARNTTVTHRIIEINNNSFITKGDTNSTKDSEPISNNLVVGKLFLTIPLLGYPVSFAKTQTGLILLIIIPAVLIIYQEILNLRKEIETLLKQKSKKKDV